MKKVIVASILVVSSITMTAQEKEKNSKNNEIKSEVVRLMDSITIANQQKQAEKDKIAAAEQADKDKEAWYKKISLRGYVQMRYNGLFSTNDKVSCDQCDKSWGTTSTEPDAKSNNGFFLRRARLVFSGQIHPNVYIYIQPDFASSPSSGVNNFAQIRDAYADISFDKKREYRVRIGQSKVPYGFENIQSSQNRLTMDRNDALNSAVYNERDLGVFFYWAPSEIRERFAMLVKDGYKGTGDYGVFAFGAYNGQTASKTEGNRDLHIVSRLTYPFMIGDQIIEPGIQAYTGKWAFSSEISSGVGTPGLNTKYIKDQRIGATFVLYPKPFGLQTEYNFGSGPRYDKYTNTVKVTDLNGGYALLNYKWDINLDKHHFLYPFAKFQYYDGGKKFEKDARSYIVRDYEFGLEWQPIKAFELTAEWVVSDRTFEDSALPFNRQQGNLLRLQAQVNF